jgi:hypothetical protein
MTILLKAIYTFNAIPTKIPMAFFAEIEKSILKFIWKHKRPQIAKAILSKMSNAGGIRIPGFKFQTVLQIHRNKNGMARAQKQTHTHQWNRRSINKSNQVVPCNSWQRRQNLHWKILSLFNKWCLENQIFTCRRQKLDPCTKINSKWIKALNLKLWNY